MPLPPRKKPPLIDRVRPWLDAVGMIAATFFVGFAFGFCVAGGLRVAERLWR